MLGRRDFLKTIATAAAAMCAQPVTKVLAIIEGKSEWLPMNDDGAFLMPLSFECDGMGQGCQKIEMLSSVWQLSEIGFHMNGGYQPGQLKLSRAEKPSQYLLDFILHPLGNVRWVAMPDSRITSKSDMWVAGCAGPFNTFAGWVIGHKKS